MTTINLGKVRITDKGVWVPDYAGGYGILDVVTFEKGSYMSKVSANSAALTDRASWVPFVDTASIELAIQEANEAAGLADQARLAIEGNLAKLELADAVQSDKIKDIENVLSTANLGQSAQLSVSVASPLSLPKNAANSGMSVKLEGLTAENLVANGDFRNGTTGWSLYTGVAALAIEGDYLTYISNVPSQAISQTGKSFATGDKLYVHAIMKVDETSTLLTAGIALSGVGASLLAGVTVGVTDTVVRGIITAASNLTSIVFGRTDTANKKVYLKKGARVINLTQIFGAGNEPDLATCDAMFSSYFEGKKNFIPTGRMRSVGKNLFNKNIFIPNKVVLGSGLLGNSTTANVSNYIRIQGGMAYSISGRTSGTFIAFYDNGYGFISSTSGSNITMSTPANAVFARFSISHADMNTCKFERGALPTPYEPYKETFLYLTAPDLRSNGTVKDQIQKGANGYELVKRVGVGSLGANGISGGDFEGGLIGTKASTDDVSTWTLNNISPISGTQDGRLQVTTAGTNGQRPMLSFALTRSIGQYRRLSFNFKVNSGTPILYSISIGGSLVHPVKTFSGSGKFEFYYIASGTTGAQLLFSGINLFDIQLDNIKDELINVTDGVSNGGSATELSDGTILYTLDTPVIYPISYGGVLNSAENGTVYHEPVIADAGVYGTNMPILLTDYPISALEEIIIHKDGIDTYLDVSTAVIAGDKLSFTHPSLQSGDLVLFTYSFAKESTNGNITATFYDSNVVKIDTVTGKAYKITDVVTNGVLTRTLTEV